MKTASVLTPSSPLTELELCRWIGTARPGERLVYHRGHLVHDVDANASRLPESDITALQRIAARARQLAADGLAHLVQQRHGPDDYSYILIARDKPRGRRSLDAMRVLPVEAVR